MKIRIKFAPNKRCERTDMSYLYKYIKKSGLSVKRLCQLTGCSYRQMRSYLCGDALAPTELVNIMYKFMDEIAEVELKYLDILKAYNKKYKEEHYKDVDFPMQELK